MVDVDAADHNNEDDVTQQSTTEFSIRELTDVELDFERALAGVSPQDGTGSSSNGSNQTSGSDKEKEGRQEGSDKEEKPLGFFGTVSNLFKACGLLCVIGCPPVPEIITRKVAFHPPECTYSAYLRADPAKKRIVAARKLQNKDFVLQPTPIHGIEQHEYDRIMRQCTTFTVTTREKTILVGAHFHPSSYPVNAREDLSSFGKQVIIFAQPNSSDIGSFMQPHSVSFAALANAMHMDIYAFDYSGYGLSSGYPSERNVYADVHAVYDYVRKERPDKRICLIGYSIGTSAVTDLASLEPPGLSGVILVAPFTSGMRLMWNAPAQEKTCCLDRFTSAEKITEVNVPVLIIHGADDTMISMDHSQELHRRLKHPVPPLFVHGADHMSIFNGTNPETFRRIYKFLKTEAFVGGGPASSSSKDKTTATTSESRDE
ncbi:hypothetical protein PENTCL1PPCAC_4487 [Pristionchus entomophagus]|uniref:Serine aminopeptidase S33 domain-containing protein n=1 Tax=Pristionchus entomophagus TaxID=358040 RepID=A0AAV5SI38_9BILA|nr:hypothetical protein PENTCL1PPCAC_4487 [Pristionchus entomophagus]